MKLCWPHFLRHCAPRPLPQGWTGWCAIQEFPGGSTGRFVLFTYCRGFPWLSGTFLCKTPYDHLRSGASPERKIFHPLPLPRNEVGQEVKATSANQRYTMMTTVCVRNAMPRVVGLPRRTNYNKIHQNTPAHHAMAAELASILGPLCSLFFLELKHRANH